MIADGSKCCRKPFDRWQHNFQMKVVLSLAEGLEPASYQFCYLEWKSLHFDKKKIIEICPWTE